MRRENLLQIALDLAAVAEALDGVPLESDDLAFAPERIEANRVLVERMLRDLDRTNG